MLDALSLAPLVSSFLLIFAAEFGDKSQLVCMLLATRHRPWPVLLGAIVAFAVLNGLAVAFGSAIRLALPDQYLNWIVAALFAFFGIRALLAPEDEDEAITEQPGHGIFATAFLMIFFAEFGDKTQLSVAALGTTQPAIAIYVGSTLALVLTSALGVFGGRWLLQHISAQTLHRISGVLFLLFAGLSLWGAL